MTTSTSTSGFALPQLLDSLADPFFVVDHAWRYTYVNAHAANVMGVTPQDLLGRVLWECFPEALDTRLNEEYRHVMSAREVRHFELHYPALHVWVEVKAFPYEDGIAVHFRDITERKLVDERREALLAVTQALTQASTRRDVAEAALRAGLPALGAYAGTILVAEDDALRVLHTVGYDDERARTWDRFETSLPLPVTDAVRTLRPVFLRERDVLEHYPALHEQKAASTRAVAALPLIVDGRALGALALSFETDRTFHDGERDFAASLAGQLAQALERARLQEARDRAARQLRDLAAAALGIHATRSLDEALAVITEQARTLVEAHQAVVSLTVGDDWAQTINAVSLSDKYAAWRDYAEMPDGSGIYALVCRMSAPLRFTQAQLEAHPAWNGFGKHAQNHPPMRGWLAVPLVGRDGANIGLIQLSDKLEGEFTPEDESILVQLAQLAASSIETARLFETAQEELQRRQDAEQELRALNFDLEQRVAARTRDLDVARRELEDRAAALDAFVAYTTSAGTETDPVALARQALEVLQVRFPHASAAYYEPQGDLWYARVWTQDMREDVLSVIRAGVPASLPLFAKTIETRREVFVDAWDPEREQVEVTDEYGSGAAYPLLVSGRLTGLLLVGLRGTPQWSEREKALVRAVGRSLNLALERSEQTERLETQNAALDAQTRALEGFATLTRNLSVQSDTRTLVRTAQEVVMSMLPDGYAVYYELDGDTWRLTVQTGDLRNPTLQAVVNAGLPYDSARTLVVPWTTREPVYQDRYDVSTDNLDEWVTHVSTTAALPILVHGLPVGVVVVALFGARPWKDVDKVVLETIVRSLGLALERSEQAREIGTWRERYEVAVKGSGHLLYDWNPQTNEIVYGGAVEEITGYRVSELAGDLTDWTERLIHEEDRGVFEREIDRVIATGDEAHVAFRLVRKDGEVRDVEDDGYFKRDEHGQVTRMIGLVKDVTERKRGEANLRRVNEELTRSNAELEQFAYIASHDLKAPLRTVTSFAQLLQRKYTGQLDAQADRYITFIVEAVGHMSTLIEDVLTFSKVGRERRVTIVPTEQVLRDVLSSLQDTLVERRAKVTFGALPNVRADETQVRQVLQNLVGNGVKFQPPGRTPHVHVAAEQAGGEVHFTVRDNGIGIAPEYFDRIFGVFQRLHTREQFSGTGVGLAIVKKIVDEHGGRIWVESQVGAGATFHFTLPAANATPLTGR